MNPIQRRRNLFGNSNIYKSAAKRLLDNAISAAIADGGTFKNSNYNATIDRIVAAMNAFGTTDLSSRMVAWVDPEYLPYWQSTAGGTASNSGCRKLYDLFRRADFVQTNTPSMPLLLLHSGENYWAVNAAGSGNSCTTPNAAANQITGDIDIKMRFDVDGGYQAGGNKSSGYGFFRASTGVLRLVLHDGAVNNTYNSTANDPLTGIHWGRVTRVSATGVITFFTSVDGVTWAQLGSTIPGFAGAFNNPVSSLNIGDGSAASNSKNIYRFTVANTIGGNPVVDFNPQFFNPSSSQTQWTSATGEVWTINTSLNTTSANNNYKGALVYRNMIMADGIDDAMASGNVTIGGQTLGVYSSNRMLNNVTNALSVFLELSQNYGLNNNSFFIGNSNDTGTVRRIQAVTLASSGVNVATSSTDVFTARLSLHSVTMDSSASPNKILLHYNTNSVTAAYNNNNTGSFSTSFPLYLFARNGTTGLANMSLHDLMLVTDITKRTEMENIIRSMSSNFAF